VDILKCERCGGRLRIVEIAKTPDDVSRVLSERAWARALRRAVAHRRDRKDARRCLARAERARLGTSAAACSA